MNTVYFFTFQTDLIFSQGAQILMVHSWKLPAAEEFLAVLTRLLELQPRDSSKLFTS